MAERFGVIAYPLLEPDCHIISSVIDEYLAYGSAANTRLDEIRDVGDIDAIPRRRLAIDRNGDLPQRWPVVNQDIGGARHRVEYIGYVPPDSAQFIEIVTEYFYPKLAVRLENLVLDAVE